MSEDLQQNAEATTQQTQLQLSDILLTAQVIQLASQRGAFRAEEFTQVGALYDRLIAFLKESGALEKKPAGDEKAAEETAAQ